MFDHYVYSIARRFLKHNLGNDQQRGQLLFVLLEQRQRLAARAYGHLGLERTADDLFVALLFERLL